MGNCDGKSSVTVTVRGTAVLPDPNSYFVPRRGSGSPLRSDGGAWRGGPGRGGPRGPTPPGCGPRGPAQTARRTPRWRWARRTSPLLGGGGVPTLWLPAHTAITSYLIYPTHPIPSPPNTCQPTPIWCPLVLCASTPPPPTPQCEVPCATGTRPKRGARGGGANLVPPHHPPCVRGWGCDGWREGPHGNAAREFGPSPSFPP